MKIAVGCLVAGAGYGAATSLVNALSSPYGELGGPLAGTVWAGVAKVLSLLMGVGWAWAALAVVMGRVAGKWARGAVAGALGLVAATVAYYVTDSLVLGDPIALYATELVMWSVAGLVLGAVLGVVGAAIRQPGVIGLLAALTVPVGAAVQVVVAPSRPHLTATPAIVVAEVVVWAVVVLGACWAVLRFRAVRRAAG